MPTSRDELYQFAERMYEEHGVPVAYVFAEESYVDVKIHASADALHRLVGMITVSANQEGFDSSFRNEKDSLYIKVTHR